MLTLTTVKCVPVTEACILYFESRENTLSVTMTGQALDQQEVTERFQTDTEKGN